MAMNGGVEQAQYYEGQEIPMDGGGRMDGLRRRLRAAAATARPGYGGGDAAPKGCRTSGFAPPVAPPGVISGINGPQYGMPITGTPIGLPGPPHIPLGHQAGLVKHEMKNRTRVLMPPPVHKMKITVKQRPGMNYPRPVNHVNVSEINRAPFRLFGGTVPPLMTRTVPPQGRRRRRMLRRVPASEWRMRGASIRGASRARSRLEFATRS